MTTEAEQKQLNLNTPPAEVTWVKLKRPKNWYPKTGEHIIGYYLGQTHRNGKYGQYKVATVQVPGEGGGQAYMVSGTTIIQALDSAGIEQGQLIRVVFNGYKELEPLGLDDKVRKMKLFDVFTTNDQLTRSQVVALVEQQSG